MQTSHHWLQHLRDTKSTNRKGQQLEAIAGIKKLTSKIYLATAQGGIVAIAGFALFATACAPHPRHNPQQSIRKTLGQDPATQTGAAPEIPANLQNTAMPVAIPAPSPETTAGTAPVATPVTNPRVQQPQKPAAATTTAGELAPAPATDDSSENRQPAPLPGDQPDPADTIDAADLGGDTAGETPEIIATDGSLVFDYTLAGDQDLVDRLRAITKNQLSVPFGMQIRFVSIERFNQAGSATSQTPAKLRITALIRSGLMEQAKQPPMKTDENLEVITFDVNLPASSQAGTQASGNDREVKSVIAGRLPQDSQMAPDKKTKLLAGFKLNQVICFDKDCSRVGLVFQREVNSQRVLAAGFVSVKQAEITTIDKIEDVDIDASAELSVGASTAQETTSKLSASIEYSVIVPGPSVARIANVSGNQLPPFATEIVDTSDGEWTNQFLPRAVYANITNRPVLMGNDPDTGTLLVSFNNQLLDIIPIENSGVATDESTDREGDETPAAPGDEQSDTDGEGSDNERVTVLSSGNTPAPGGTTARRRSAGAGAVALPSENAKTPNGVYNVQRDATKYPMMVAATTAFDNMRNDSILQDYVSKYRRGGPTQNMCSGIQIRSGNRVRSPGLRPDRVVILNYIENALNVAPFVDAIGQAVDVTPEVGYLLGIESRYLRNSDKYRYDGQQTAIADRHGDRAVGPWQMKNVYAEDVKKRNPGVAFQIMKAHQNMPKPNAADDRAYFMNSTYMAMLGLKNLQKNYQYDPTMMIMAYHRGSGNISNDTSALRARGGFAQGYKLKFKDIVRLRINTKGLCEGLDYTYHFLALRELGQYRHAYHYVGRDGNIRQFKDIAPTTSKGYMNRLYRPRAVLPAGVDPAALVGQVQRVP
jgi:hypothetical protein